MVWRVFAAYAAGLGLPIWAAPAAAVLCAFDLHARRFESGMAVALLAAALLGGLDRAPRAPRVPEAGVRAHFVGWIVEPPERRLGGERALAVVERLSGPGLRAEEWRDLRLRLNDRTRVTHDSGSWGSSGGRSMPRYGHRLAARGMLRPARPPRNFGLDGEAPGLLACGAVATFEIESFDLLPGERGAAWRRALLEPLRARLRSAIDVVLAPREAGLLVALLVGARDGVDSSTNDTWAALGTNHILSISGMHVALVAGAVLALAGAPYRRRGLVALVASTWIYAAVGGLGPTVLRAALMATWAACAIHFARRRRGILALGFAALGLVLLAPQRRHDLGLQLSCAATGGLLAVAPVATRLVRRLGATGRAGKAAGWAFAGALVGVAAQIATLPLQIAHFGAVSWIGPVTNLFMVPVSDLGLVLGLAGAPIALCSATLGRPLLLLSGALLHVLCELAVWTSHAHEFRAFPTVDRWSIGAAWTLAIAALAAPLFWAANRRRMAGVAAALAIPGLAILVVRCVWPAAPAWRFEALDVGQGDALVLAIGRATWVIDAGDARPSDQGARVVVPHLRRLGVHRLRGLVLTHPHRDHCGGAQSLLRALEVDTLYVARAAAADSLYDRLRSEFPQVPVRELSRGARLGFGNDYFATVVWPESSDVLGSGPNGTSVVLAAAGGAHPDLLLMGDLEADGEAHLDLGRLPRRCILKAGHHGSDTSSTPALLDALQPEVAVLSVGAKNRYRHPGPHTLAALAAHGSVVLRTDRGGAVRLVQRGATLWLERPSAPPFMLDPNIEARRSP